MLFKNNERLIFLLDFGMILIRLQGPTMWQHFAGGQVSSIYFEIMMWANAMTGCRKDLLGTGLGRRQHKDSTLTDQGS